MEATASINPATGATFEQEERDRIEQDRVDHEYELALGDNDPEAF